MATSVALTLLPPVALPVPVHAGDRQSGASRQPPSTKSHLARDSASGTSDLGYDRQRQLVSGPAPRPVASAGQIGYNATGLEVRSYRKGILVDLFV